MTTLPSTTTARTAGQHVGDHNTLHDAYNTDSRFLPATVFRASDGSPTQAVSNGFDTWALDQTTDEAVSTYLKALPDHWTTFTGKALVSNASGTGDVRLETYTKTVSIGQALATPSWAALGTPVTQSMLADVKVVTMFTGLAVVTGDIVVIRFYRDANHAADTLAGDLLFHGLLLEKAS